MKVGQLVGGGLCLAAAVLLAILMVTLQEGKVVFMIGDTNAPIVPVIILAVLGIALLFTARKR
jgi:hypothetical protein